MSIRTPHWSLLPLLLGGVISYPATFAATPSSLQVTAAYARSTQPGQEVGAAYISLHNAGNLDDALVGVHGATAKQIELHRSMSMNGMSHMMREDKLSIPAHGDLSMAPGGVHLMLEGLQQPLKPGTSLELHLDFAHSAPLTVLVPVH